MDFYYILLELEFTPLEFETTIGGMILHALKNY